MKSKLVIKHQIQN